MKNQLAWALSLFVLFMFACKPATTGDEAADTMAGDTTKTAEAPAPAEFADPKYAETVKSGMDALSRGDVPTWLNNYADNAVYYWNYGDSLVGKAAISEYWTKRRSEVIDSLTFRNQILLPIKINTPQSIEAPGVWVLAWHQTTAKYKTGKSMTQWIHIDHHFNADGKIDQSIHYIDRVLINEALKK